MNRHKYYVIVDTKPALVRIDNTIFSIPDIAAQILKFLSRVFLFQRSPTTRLITV